MQQIPVLISIPHGGLDIPEELINRVCIKPEDIFLDMDPFTQEIYDLDPWVIEVLTTDIARAFVDLNRAVDDLPPQNPDGIIKSMTCNKKPIYLKGKEPGESLRQTLIERYYHPYHRKAREIIGKNNEVKLALDCHSMAAEPPPIAPDKANKKSKKRPLICLGNAHGQACDPVIVKKLAKCFCKAFFLEEKDVTINQPFSGGYITRIHGNNPIPWVQVEINRSLYLTSPWSYPSTRQVDNYRLMELNDMFKKTLELYFDK